MALNFDDKRVKVTLAIIITVVASTFIYLDYSRKNKTSAKTTTVNTNDDNGNYEQTIANRDKHKPDRNVDNYNIQQFINQQKKEQEQVPDEPQEELPIQEQNQETEGKENTKAPKQKVTYQKHEAEVVEKPKVRRRHGFASSHRAREEEQGITSSNTNMRVKVAILKTQKVKSGDIVLLRTINKCKIKGKDIPSNTIIEGNIMFSGSRMDIIVHAIKQTPCTLFAYSLTGNKGLTLNSDVNYEIKNDASTTVLNEATKAVSIPYIGSLTQSATRKKVADPTITLKKGTRMELRFSI